MQEVSYGADGNKPEPNKKVSSDFFSLSTNLVIAQQMPISTKRGVKGKHCTIPLQASVLLCHLLPAAAADRALSITVKILRNFRPLDDNKNSKETNKMQFSCGDVCVRADLPRRRIPCVPLKKCRSPQTVLPYSSPSPRRCACVYVRVCLPTALRTGPTQSKLLRLLYVQHQNRNNC